MKLFLMVMALFSITGSVIAQCFISFDTRSTSQKIYDWDGTPLAGTNYLAQLYAADGTTTDDSKLTAKGVPVNFRTGVNAGYVVTTAGKNSLGQSFLSSVEVSDTAGIVTLQVRAWTGGSVPSFEMAVMSVSRTAESSLFQVTVMNLPGAPANLTGFTSFKFNAPEPTTIALGGMGFVALLMLRRRR